MPILQDSSRDFLSRAQHCFARSEDAPEMFLYAALELRLGIEARLHEYLDGAEQYADLKKRGWRIADLARDLERVYKSGTQIVSFEVLRQDAVSSETLLFTPVTSRAKQIAQQLGDYLHYSERFRPTQDPWRQVLESLVRDGIQELKISTTGTLLVPPIWNSKTRQAKVILEVFRGESFESVSQKLGKLGDKFQAKVEYLDSLPSWAL